MRHDTSIPDSLHVGARDTVKRSLGLFWSSVFTDQDLVDAELTARVLSASQRYIDAMEALSLRDHTGSPVFHREHWHPLVIRLSERNSASGLSFDMADTPTVGGQDAGCAYLEGEVFEVGRNAEYSKVYTYPFSAMSGCPLMGVGTCICDAISGPSRVLMQGRDFAVDGGVLTIRKEQDPFSCGNYRIVEDGADRLAVMWACDGTFDTDNVGDFIGYPLGFDVASTPASSRMMSALWDLLVNGVVPQYLNAALAAVFDVPSADADGVVESVKSDTASGTTDIVTQDRVYRVPTSTLDTSISVGHELHVGDLLTTEIQIYHSLSKDELQGLVEDKRIVSIALPPGSVYGVDKTVVLENCESVKEDGGWFKLNAGDTGDSPFWSSVRSRVSATGLENLFSRIAEGRTTVNPLKDIGYTVMANTVLVLTTKGLCGDPCAGGVFKAIRSLVPTYASLFVVHGVSEDERVDASDNVEGSIIKADFTQSSMAEPEDDVTFTFVPSAATEV